MKTVDAALVTGMTAANYVPLIKLVTGATTIRESRILLYKVHERGPTGQATLEVHINNRDGAYTSLISLKPQIAFYTQEGLRIGGTEYFVTRQQWNLTETIPSGLVKSADRITLKAINNWIKFDTVPLDDTAWQQQSIGTIIDAIATLAGVTLTRDSANLWSHVIDWKILGATLLQTKIRALVGSTRGAIAHAWGRFNTDGSWYLKGFSYAPAADVSIGGGSGEAKIIDTGIYYSIVPTRIQVNGATAQAAGVIDEIEAEIGVTRWMACQVKRLAEANLADRLKQEAVEQRERYHRGIITITPDLRLQIGDTVALYNVPGVSAGTKFHVAQIWFDYKPGKFEMRVMVRQAASTDTTVHVTPYPALTVDPLPVEGQPQIILDETLIFLQPTAGCFDVIRIDPYEANTLDFYTRIGTVDNPSGRKNVTLNWGYNQGCEGGPYDANDATIYEQFETYYNPGGTPYLEWHVDAYTADGLTTVRPIQATVVRSNMYTTLIERYDAFSHVGAQSPEFQLLSANIVTDASDSQIIMNAPLYLRHDEIAIYIQTATPTTKLTLDSSPAITFHSVDGHIDSNTTSNYLYFSNWAGVYAPPTTVTFLDSGTSNTPIGITIAHNTSGTAAAGFGVAQLVAIETSTTPDTSAHDIAVTWVVATHASRTARAIYRVYDTAAREYMRAEASGTVAMLGFFGANAVVKPTALTTALTTLTFNAPGTPDYAIAAVQLAGYGFSTADEGDTVMSVIANLQTRVNELETKLQALGLLT